LLGVSTPITKKIPRGKECEPSVIRQLKIIYPRKKKHEKIWQRKTIKRIERKEYVITRGLGFFFTENIVYMGFFNTFLKLKNYKQNKNKNESKFRNRYTSKYLIS